MSQIRGKERVRPIQRTSASSIPWSNLLVIMGTGTVLLEKKEQL
jgi:hypothetical protein